MSWLRVQFRIGIVSRINSRKIAKYPTIPKRNRKIKVNDPTSAR